MLTKITFKMGGGGDFCYFFLQNTMQPLNWVKVKKPCKLCQYVYYLAKWEKVMFSMGVWSSLFACDNGIKVFDYFISEWLRLQHY